VLALLSGAADLVQNAVSPRLADALRDRPELVVETVPGGGYTYIAYNLKRPPLDDVRVRQAFAHAVNRAALIEHKFRGTARPALGLLPTTHWAYNPQAVDFAYDPAQANRLLDTAGHPRKRPGASKGGTRFELTLKVSADKFRRNIATLIAHDLAQVGIDIKVQPLETGTLLADVKAGKLPTSTSSSGRAAASPTSTTGSSTPIASPPSTTPTAAATRGVCQRQSRRPHRRRPHRDGFGASQGHLSGTTGDSGAGAALPQPVARGRGGDPKAGAAGVRGAARCQHVWAVAGPHRGVRRMPTAAGATPGPAGPATAGSMPAHSDWWYSPRRLGRPRAHECHHGPGSLRPRPRRA
jgi:hypothetical protein